MRASLVAAALALLLAPAALALPPALQRHAAALPSAERARLAQRHARMRAMSPQQSAELRRRVAEWDALPRQVQRERRDAWAAWQALPESERERLREAARTYAALPPERQQALNQRWAELDGYERAGWMLGPDLGADWPQLHGLFALVPESERAPLLEALRGLGARGRADLAVLAQRIPPERRADLRRALLTTPPENRGAWLRRQVGPAP
ncbi:DUF3106 domain-containing protein [Luteimonas sp. RD2P54]|uniref:DUF3106 domain-containing protein n=1 Tax=Luteimonas endophytica TaxID=3042023 RepID=A0ABT6J6I4_9GAMM|nr:DUF3106 domain-containing protein [Luteimonas endophytica]MDH5822429.1 DUF3106 domain-containing protein [Luteimonas endophytica]